MAKLFKWLVFSALGLVLLLAAVVFLLHRWVHTDDFRERAEREASAALGVPVTLSGVAVGIWPLPSIVLSNITVQAKPQPLSLGRVEVRPQWRPLLQRRLVVDTLLVRHAVLPQQGIDALLVLLQKRKQTTSVSIGLQPKNTQNSSPQASQVDWVPRRTVLDEVTWLSVTGARTTVAGEMKVGDDGLPDDVSLKLTEGHLKGLAATLKRQDKPASTSGNTSGSSSAHPSAMPALTTPGPDQWALRVDVGGGQIEGVLGLQRLQLPVPARGKAPATTAEELVMQGQLQAKGVEVSALTAPSHALTGRLESSTTLNARASTTSALVDALHTQSSFTVRNGVLHGLDLVKAVQTVGLSRGGQTALDTLSGQVSTQGRSVQLSQLVASSGVLSATGEVSVTPAKALGGHVTVALAGGGTVATAVGAVAGIPLSVGGTLDAPEVTLSRAALVGAALGTVLMPGAGTAAGAKLGDRVSEGLRGLFGK